MKYYFEEIAPLVPIRLPKTKNTGNILYVCHGRRYRIQNKPNIYTLDVFKEAWPDFQISIKSKDFKLKMKKYKEYFDTIYMLCCPITSYLIKYKHYIPNKLVFDNLSFLLKKGGFLHINNYVLFNKKSKKYSDPIYFLSYINDFEFYKLKNNEDKELILQKTKK